MFIFKCWYICILILPQGFGQYFTTLHSLCIQKDPCLLASITWNFPGRRNMGPYLLRKLFLFCTIFRWQLWRNQCICWSCSTKFWTRFLLQTLQESSKANWGWNSSDGGNLIRGVCCNARWKCTQPGISSSPLHFSFSVIEILIFYENFICVVKAEQNP